MSITKNLQEITSSIPATTTLVAVSKTKPVSDLQKAYDAGHRVFGENKVQEMEAKWKELPKDIQWHMIGHVQRNKVKYMAPFVSLVHSVDSPRLLKEINKQAKKNDRVIDCLLQLRIAEEDTKFGMTEAAINTLLASEETKNFQHVNIKGLMGMATFTEDEPQLTREFQKLKSFYDSLKQTQQFSVLSMGMSGDYKLAIKNGSTMVRIGSAIFGERN